MTRLSSRDIASLTVFADEPSFAWKYKALATLLDPGKHHRVAVLGVGSGLELYLLRSLLPNAYIAAFDWVSTCSSKNLEDNDVHYVVGDILETFSACSQQFDVVFTHHFFEHMYQPLALARLARASLTQGGLFINGLPLLLEGLAYRDYIYRSLIIEGRPRLLDLSLLDVGHPVKVSRAGLATMLLSEGYGDVSFYSCPEMVVRSKFVNTAQAAHALACCLRAYKRFVLPFKRVLSRPLEIAMAVDLPGWRLALKTFFHVERKYIGSFSGPSIANYAPDFLVVASKLP